MSPVHRLVVGVAVFISLTALPRDVSAQPFQSLTKPDPKAGKVDAKLDGVWVNKRFSPDGKTWREFRLTFVDGQHLVYRVISKVDFRVEPVEMVMRMKYEFAADELRMDTIEKWAGEDKIALTENDKKRRVWKLEWEKDEKSFTANTAPTDPESKPLRFARDDQPAAKVVGDPLVPETLTKIDRKIAKLPKFESAKPGYLLLVFGKAAKEKVWVVFDGANLYVDKNANGDLTEDGEKIPADLGNSRPPKSYVYSVSDVGEKKYGLQVSTISVGPDVVAPHVIVVHQGKMLQKVGPTDIRFKPTPEEARVVHFGSTLLVARPSLTMQAPLNAAKADDWRVQVGTPGVGAGSFASFGNDDVAKDVHPVAEFVFQSKVPGGKPITKKVTLDQRCCGDQFYAKVEVPADAADAPAKVTLSFPNCPFGTVLAQTYDVPVIREK
jgi:hypothetical protein